MESVSVMAVVIASAVLLSGCITAPVVPQGAAEARSKLTELQNDPQLDERAPMEVREAEAAVRDAEQPLPEADAELAKHRVYMAERKVEIARARAETRYAEDQRLRLAEERDAARLTARTREADTARAKAERARTRAERARGAEAEATAKAAREAADMQRQIEELEAEATDRGLVLTLGDVLFATGSARLQGGADRNLGKLVTFLNKHSERRVLIEGHTDSVGSAVYNRELSRQRAESVRSYLVREGIAVQRLTVAAMGMDRPVASNDTAMGRQQNRRVEIIIENQAQSGFGSGQSSAGASGQY